MLVGAVVLALDLVLALLDGEPLQAVFGRTVALLLSVPAITWYALDRMARRSAEREQKLRWRPETLLRNISDLIVVIDTSGVIHYQSPSIERELGYGAAELMGSNVQNLLVVGDGPSILEVVGELAPGDQTQLELQVRGRDGRMLPVDVLATNAGEHGRDDRVLTMHNVSKWKELEEQLTRQAFHDPLTGLPNRALYIDRLDQALARTRRHAKGVAVMFLDLDDFKTVNDSLGHTAGDRLIRDVAERVQHSLRPGDTAARLGGDEFALLMEDVDEGQAAAIAGRLLAALEKPFDLGDRSLLVGVSIGIAISSDELRTAADMLRAADIAMYAAKDAGKGQYRLFEPQMLRASTARLRLGTELRGAVERGELVVHYQPIVDLPSGEVAAMEALVRWAHPERGLVPPNDFIPLAERSGLIVPLGAFVLREACREARSWNQARPERPVSVSVNVSGIQLQDAGFVAAVSLALEEAGLSPGLLTLEITESVMALDDEDVGRRMAQLKGMGVRLAIDDFGSGFSSLGSIGRFPLDQIKIDKSLIDTLPAGRDQVTLVRSIIKLARDLRLRTVAEGVENDEQRRRLVAAGCNQAQGNLFSRPLDARQASTYLIGHAGITLWMGHWGHELNVIREVLTDFETRRPGIRVEVVGGMHDDRITASLDDPAGPNVVSSFKSRNFGTYASAIGLIDLQPYLDRDGIDLATFPEATMGYSRHGTKRWALPLMADAYGLYCNSKLFAAAGLPGPPRTMSELTDYAKRLTRRRPDGSLAVVGFNPLSGFYENSVAIYGHHFGASWFDAEGNPSVATDPNWATMMRWLKDLVDFYGYQHLVRFGEEVGEEFSKGNAFESERLAMVLDGEWRIGFIAANRSEVEYSAAPMPVADGRPDLYGSGFISGSVIGIPSRAGQQDEAWELIKYLTTDDAALVKLSNGLRNLPTTLSALRSPELVRDPNFTVFMDIFAHPQSGSAPITSLGTAYQDPLHAFAQRWQQGSLRDLQRGLREVDRLISGRTPDARERRGPRASASAARRRVLADLPAALLP